MDRTKAVHTTSRARVRQRANRRHVWVSLCAVAPVCLAWVWLIVDAKPPAVVNADVNSQRLENMSSNELLALKRKLKRFEKLSPERQRELRQFHRRLLEHPRSESLRRVLKEYYTWLASLDSRRQAEISDEMDREQRVTKIRDMRTQQIRALSVLPMADFEKFDVWLRELAQAKETLIRETFRGLPRGSVRNVSLDENSNAERLLRFLIRTPGIQSRLISEADIEKLREALSDTTAQMMADPVIARNLIVHFVRHQYVSPEELHRFYVHELPPPLRDELDKLPPDLMAAQLRRMYQLKQIGVSLEQWGRRVNNQNRPPSN